MPRNKPAPLLLPAARHRYAPPIVRVSPNTLHTFHASDKNFTRLVGERNGRSSTGRDNGGIVSLPKIARHFSSRTSDSLLFLVTGDHCRRGQTTPSWITMAYEFSPRFLSQRPVVRNSPKRVIFSAAWFIGISWNYLSTRFCATKKRFWKLWG